MATSLYIHVPYCRHKCIYCDFYTGGIRIANWKLFTTRILSELETRLGEFKSPIDTLYIGGGTPSIVPASNFSILMRGIRERLKSKLNVEEFTIEVNPEDVNEDNCKSWLKEGVNRISLGIQSFDDHVLTAIGRHHDSREAIDAYNTLRHHFNNISIDLMFGLTEQTLSSWKNTVETALFLNPEHISAYSLMLEKGTAMTELVESGRMDVPDEETNRNMFSLLSSSLASKGYQRYEISNYCKPGYESRHNSGYWTGKPYIGLGPSAHSYDGAVTRKSNRPDLHAYLSDNDFTETEILTEEELFEEKVMLSLRTSIGLDMDVLKLKFGEIKARKVIINAENNIKRGNLIYDGKYIKLTQNGIMTADSVICDLIM